MSPIFHFDVKATALSSREVAHSAELIRNAKSILDSTQSFNIATETERGHMIIAILIAIIGVSFVALLLYLLQRRFNLRSCHRVKLDIEEGRKEVTEARAFRPQDETLKEGYLLPFVDHDGLYIRTPALQIPPPPSSQLVTTPLVTMTRISFDSVDGVDAHPLFHPGIKRSRTIHMPMAPQYSNRALRGSISYSDNVDEQPSSLKSKTSTISLGSYYRTESTPMTPFTTMQTRRPETPPIFSERFSRRSPPPPPLKSRRQVHSFWSESETASLAPTSPSLCSPTCSRALSPRPASHTFQSGQLFNEDPFGTSNKLLMSTPIRPIFSIDKERMLPILSYPLPLILRKSSCTLGQVVLPLSPSAAPRMLSPIAAGTLSPFGDGNAAPTKNIQLWLSGTGATGTASSIESVIGHKRRSSDPDIYRTEYFPRFSKISPIKSIRSSRSSLCSGEEILIGAAM